MEGIEKIGLSLPSRTKKEWLFSAEEIVQRKKEDCHKLTPLRSEKSRTPKKDGPLPDGKKERARKRDKKCSFAVKRGGGGKRDIRGKGKAFHPVPALAEKKSVSRISGPVRVPFTKKEKKKDTTLHSPSREKEECFLLPAKEGIDYLATGEGNGEKRENEGTLGYI